MKALVLVALLLAVGGQACAQDALARAKPANAGRAKPVPVAALVCCAVILLTCVLAAWAMGSVSGALLPGMGWVITSFVLSMPVSNGSVIITNTAPGRWYLYGGTLSVAAGVVASFVGGIRWAGRR